jgi:hypothetical protein
VPASIEETLALLAEWRRIESQRRVAVSAGMSFWKRSGSRFSALDAARRCFRHGAAVPSPPRDAPPQPSRASHRGLGVTHAAGSAGIGGREGVPLIRVEEGLSVGRARR